MSFPGHGEAYFEENNCSRDFSELLKLRQEILPRVLTLSATLDVEIML
jgi:hypothetical protein